MKKIYAKQGFYVRACYGKQSRKYVNYFVDRKKRVHNWLNHLDYS